MNSGIFSFLGVSGVVVSYMNYSFYNMILRFEPDLHTSKCSKISLYTVREKKQFLIRSK